MTKDKNKEEVKEVLDKEVIEAHDNVIRIFNKVKALLAKEIDDLPKNQRTLIFLRVVNLLTCDAYKPLIVMQAETIASREKELNQ